MTDDGGVLLVHAHPDDEAFGTGGLIARSVAEGRRVDLVTCTGGEEGEIHDPTLDQDEAQPRLREIRHAELQCALEALRGDGPGTLELRGDMPGATLIPYPVKTDALDAAHWWRDQIQIRRLTLEYCKYLAVLVQESVMGFFRDQPDVGFALLVCDPGLIGYYGRLGWREFNGRLRVRQRGVATEFTLCRVMTHPVQSEGPTGGTIDLCGPPW